MFKSIHKYFIFVLFSVIGTAYGQQEAAKYPVRFSQYYTCYALVNPAAAGTSDQFELTMGNKRLTGSFNKISTYFLNTNIQLGSQRRSPNSPYSVIGMLAYNDREGKYLNRTRLYLTYVWHGYLTNNVKFSGGFHIGGMNYSVKGTELSGGGSDIAPDGSAGIQFYNNKFHLGASYNQIFNSEIQPINETAKLSSYFNFFGDYIFHLNSDVNIQGATSLMFKRELSNYLADYTLILEYKKAFATIVGIHNNNNVVLSVEGRNIIPGMDGLDLGITYSFPIKSYGIKTGFYELGIKYSYNKNKN